MEIHLRRLFGQVAKGADRQCGMSFTRREIACY
jgi:hypothetical protein